MKYEELMNYGEGDIITLSDFQTQEQFEAPEVDFRIISVRTYEEPDGAFTYRGYILIPPDAEEDREEKYMILLMQSGDVHEIRVYYLDAGDEVYEAPEGEEECPFYALLDLEENALGERLESIISTEKGDRDVTWDLQDQTHGVLVTESENECLCTLGDYYTEDDNGGNNYCLIDWRGDEKDGWIELWYGCPIKEHEIEIVSTSTIAE